VEVSTSPSTSANAASTTSNSTTVCAPSTKLVVAVSASSSSCSKSGGARPTPPITGFSTIRKAHYATDAGGKKKYLQVTPDMERDLLAKGYLDSDISQVLLDRLCATVETFKHVKVFGLDSSGWLNQAGSANTDYSHLLSKQEADATPRIGLHLLYREPRHFVALVCSKTVLYYFDSLNKEPCTEVQHVIAHMYGDGVCLMRVKMWKQNAAECVLRAMAVLIHAAYGLGPKALAEQVYDKEDLYQWMTRQTYEYEPDPTANIEKPACVSRGHPLIKGTKLNWVLGIPFVIKAAPKQSSDM
jgi:hypothetical protein